MTLQLMTLLLIGCLERVTGEAVPLDPRFVANQPGQAGAEGGGAGSDGGKIPFSGQAPIGIINMANLSNFLNKISKS